MDNLVTAVSHQSCEGSCSFISAVKTTKKVQTRDPKTSGEFELDKCFAIVVVVTAW
jgi:hypothetical protein